MRVSIVIVLPVALAGCLARGERDPTRYPGGQPKPKPDDCVVSLELGSASGITPPAQAGDRRIVARGQVPPFEQVPPGGSVAHMACTPPAGGANR